MKLRKKMLIIIIALMISTLGLLLIITESVIMKSYLSLEEENAQLEAERAFNGVDFTIHKLDAMAIDWAHWDDTYEFINDKNVDYLYRNIVPSTFTDSEMEYMIILDEEYNAMLKREFDLDKETFSSAPESFVQVVKENINTTGIFFIDEKAIAFTIFDIQDSNEVKDGIGALAFGFEFNNNVLDKLRDAFKSDINITHGIDVEQDEPIKFNRSKFETTATFQIPYRNVEKWMNVEVKIPNKTSILGRKTVRNYMLFITLTLLLFTIVLFRYMRKVIIMRLSKLSKDAYAISHSEDLSKRLSIEGEDEISELKDDINVMLNKIENMNEEITKHASVDDMTGALNRRSGFETLGKLLEETENPTNTICVAYVDINNLKIVNDHYGHQSGDLLIKDVVTLLKSNLREYDKISRLGGDEFLIIFPEINYETVVEIFKRIEKSIMVFNESGKREYDIGISKGIALYDFDMTVEEFVEIADKRMYTDKQRKKKGKLR